MPRDRVLVADMLRYARQAARAGAGLTAETLEADPDRQSMKSVPFSCRLEDATRGNTKQLEATSGNSQRSDVKAFRLQAATGSNSRHLPATRPKPRC
jgi:hypothetical protein